LSTLKGNRIHVPSFLYLYEHLFASSQIERLFSEMDRIISGCELDHELLSTLCETDTDTTIEEQHRHRQENHRFWKAFAYGPTKRRREKEKYARMNYYSVMLRGQLSLVAANFSAAEEDFAKMKSHATATAPDYFLHRCMKLVDLSLVSSQTQDYCRRMLYDCRSDEEMDKFVAALNKGSAAKYFSLPTVPDQSYFLSCYAFRQLKVYTSDYSDDTLISFWGMLTSPKTHFHGLQYCCTDAVVLTTLFVELHHNSRLFQSSLPGKFQLLYEACVMDKEVGSIERAFGDAMFFKKMQKDCENDERLEGVNYFIFL